MAHRYMYIVITIYIVVLWIHRLFASILSIHDFFCLESMNVFEILGHIFNLVWLKIQYPYDKITFFESMLSSRLIHSVDFTKLVSRYKCDFNHRNLANSLASLSSSFSISALCIYAINMGRWKIKSKLIVGRYEYIIRWALGAFCFVILREACGKKGNIFHKAASLLLILFIIFPTNELLFWIMFTLLTLLHVYFLSIEVFSYTKGSHQETMQVQYSLCSLFLLFAHDFFT